MVYSRLSSEGRYVETIPRRPPKLRQVSLGEGEDKLDPPQGGQSKSGDFIFTKRSLSDSSQSARTLETLTEDEVEETGTVTNESSYETAASDTESSTEKSGGQALSSSRPRICSPGSGKTLKLVKPSRQRGASIGSAPPQVLLALSPSEVRKPFQTVYFLGASGCGKSSVIQVLSTGFLGQIDMVKTERTVRMKLSHNANSEALTLDAVDTSRNYRAYLSQLRLASLIVFVYSVTNKDSFIYTSRALEACMDMNVPFRCIVVANKMDCVPENPREVTANEGISLAAAHKAFHVEVSCVTLLNMASLKTVILTTLHSPHSPASPKRGSSGRPKPHSPSVFKSSSSSSLLHTTPVSSSLSSSEVTSTDASRCNQLTSVEDPAQHQTSSTTTTLINLS